MVLAKIEKVVGRFIVVWPLEELTSNLNAKQTPHKSVFCWTAVRAWVCERHAVGLFPNQKQHLRLGEKTPMEDFHDHDGDGIDDHIKCPQCGNIFMGDSMFCRKCGFARPEAVGEAGHSMTKDDITKALTKKEAALVTATNTGDVVSERQLKLDIKALGRAEAALHKGEMEAAEEARIQALPLEEREAILAKRQNRTPPTFADEVRSRVTLLILLAVLSQFSHIHCAPSC